MAPARISEYVKCG